MNNVEYTYDLTPPLSLGHVETSIFDELYEEFPQIPETARIDINSSIGNKPPKIAQMLAGYSARLMQYLNANGFTEPTYVHYSLSTDSVAPGRAQRVLARNWHLDGKFNAVQPVLLTAASSLPTEFLIAPSGSSDRSRAIVDDATNENNFDNQKLQPSIDNGTLAIYTPQPLQALINYRNIHRSAINTTGKTQSRVWFGILARFDKD